MAKNGATSPPTADEDPGTEGNPPDQPGEPLPAEKNSAHENPADADENPAHEEPADEIESFEDDGDDDEEFSVPPQSLGDTPTLDYSHQEVDPVSQEEGTLNSQGLFNKRSPKGNLFPHPPAGLEVNSPSSTPSQPEPSGPRSSTSATATATATDTPTGTNPSGPPKPHRLKPVRQQPAKIPEVSSAPA